MSLNRSLRPSRRSFLAGTGAVAAGLTVSPKWGWGAEAKALNFYNWDTYIGETTLDDFKGATGIEVTMDLFADNAELFAKLRGGNPGYDVIVPSNDYVERMVAAKLLTKLDHAKIPNLKNVAPVHMNPAFDPGRVHSVPYMWGTIGIGYRKSRVDGVPDSWKWLYDSNKYAGKVALLAEPTTVIQIAAKYLGNSMNVTDPAKLEAAANLIIKQKPNIRVFAEDNGQDLLLSGEVDLTQEWNGDILQVMAEDPDISYVVPKEGGLLWEDTLAIPVGAPHPNNAHAFINYILDAKVGADIANFIQYATPNAAARALMGKDYSENPAIFPPTSVVESSEVAIYQGPEYSQLIDRLWTRINAA
ncbi:MAG: spermidine/putrescine ABC transporter substrate-binding protein [Alphaproteobacteria bacterium]|nr:spermidine/putrescine ABC transporter substrate-binding protein [Alphaproteobacteria bacterium]